MISKTNLQIDEQILKTDRVICRHISNMSNLSRGEISQDILAQLRHFLEHIMLKIYANGADIEDSHENIQKAVKYVKNEGSLRHLSRFHHFLQVSVSHRTLEEENSERLMLKYYEYLLRIKDFLNEKYSLDVLSNLDQFPLETDDCFKEYYEKIAQKVDQYKTPIRNGFRFDRFYIQTIKPFFFGNKIYYEVAFIPANDRSSKTDRIIAFTDIEITDFYAVKFAIANNYIDLFGKQMPIRIIVDWEVNIRPCEFSNFSKLIDNNEFTPGKAEQRNLAQYLTETGLNLSEIVMFSDEAYQEVSDRIVPKNNGKDNPSLSSAIKHLEKKFKIPYDQRGAGDAASWISDLNPKNHHFKSLGHNPTLIGLFFSILDQFSNASHFVSEGELISLQDADGSFELRGNSVPSKMFCGFINWFGHLISDMSGSSSSKGRGMGIPSPLWSWTNDIIAIKRKLNISASEFDKNINDLALQIYKEGYRSYY